MDLFHNYNVNTIKTKINLNLSLCIITHNFARFQRLKINNLERWRNVTRQKNRSEIGSETSK